MAMTTFDIARCYAAQFGKDRTLTAWATEAFGKPFAVHIGLDVRRPPSLDEAPYIIILPDTVESGSQRKDVSHVLRIIPGIEDAAMETVNNTLESRGLRRVAKELVPMLETCMRLALPLAKLQAVATQFSIQEFPLIEAFMDIAVDDPQPIGRRN